MRRSSIRKWPASNSGGDTDPPACLPRFSSVPPWILSFLFIPVYHRNVRCRRIEHNLLSTSLNKQHNLQRTNTTQESKQTFERGVQIFCNVETLRYFESVSQNNKHGLETLWICWKRNLLAALCCPQPGVPVVCWVVEEDLAADPSRNPGVLLRGERESFLSTGKSREIWCGSTSQDHPCPQQNLFLMKCCRYTASSLYSDERCTRATKTEVFVFWVQASGKRSSILLIS